MNDAFLLANDIRRHRERLLEQGQLSPEERKEVDRIADAVEKLVPEPSAPEPAALEENEPSVMGAGAYRPEMPEPPAIAPAESEPAEEPVDPSRPND